MQSISLHHNIHMHMQCVRREIDHTAISFGSMGVLFRARVTFVCSLWRVVVLVICTAVVAAAGAVSAACTVRALAGCALQLVLLVLLRRWRHLCRLVCAIRLVVLFVLLPM